MKKSNILLTIVNSLFLIFTITVFLLEMYGNHGLYKVVYLLPSGYKDFITNLIPLFISTFIVIFSNQNIINTKKKLQIVTFFYMVTFLIIILIYFIYVWNRHRYVTIIFTVTLFLISPYFIYILYLIKSYKTTKCHSCSALNIQKYSYCHNCGSKLQNKDSDWIKYFITFMIIQTSVLITLIFFVYHLLSLIEAFCLFLYIVIPNIFFTLLMILKLKNIQINKMFIYIATFIFLLILIASLITDIIEYSPIWNISNKVFWVTAYSLELINFYVICNNISNVNLKKS